MIKAIPQPKTHHCEACGEKFPNGYFRCYGPIRAKHHPTPLTPIKEAS